MVLEQVFLQKHMNKTCSRWFKTTSNIHWKPKQCQKYCNINNFFPFNILITGNMGMWFLLSTNKKCRSSTGSCTIKSNLSTSLLPIIGRTWTVVLLYTLLLLRIWLFNFWRILWVKKNIRWTSRLSWVIMWKISYNFNRISIF